MKIAYFQHPLYSKTIHWTVYLPYVWEKMHLPTYVNSEVTHIELET